MLFFANVIYALFLYFPDNYCWDRDCCWQLLSTLYSINMDYFLKKFMKQKEGKRVIWKVCLCRKNAIFSSKTGRKETRKVKDREKCNGLSEGSWTDHFLNWNSPERFKPHPLKKENIFMLENPVQSWWSRS